MEYNSTKILNKNLVCSAIYVHLLVFIRVLSCPNPFLKRNINLLGVELFVLGTRINPYADSLQGIGLHKLI